MIGKYSLLAVLILILSAAGVYASLSGSHVINVTLEDVNEITVNPEPIALILPGVPSATGYDGATGDAVKRSTFNYRHNRATAQTLRVTSVFEEAANWANVFVQVETTATGMSENTIAETVELSNGTGTVAGQATARTLLSGIEAGDFTPTLIYKAYHVAGANNSPKSMTVTYTISDF